MKHSEAGSRSNPRTTGGFVVFVVRRPKDPRRIRREEIERIDAQADEPRRGAKTKMQSRR